MIVITKDIEEIWLNEIGEEIIETKLPTEQDLDEMYNEYIKNHPNEFKEGI